MTDVPFPDSADPTVAAPRVSLEDARLVHDRTVLFDGLSLDLAAGRWTVLLGPSGVGKTTLLRLLAGLDTGAEARISDGDGADLTGRIGYLAQRDLLLPWLTILENTVLGARLRGENGADARALAETLLRRAGLGDATGLLPSACSGGMRQRAALVRTLVENRPVVLMDEPFSALDAITRLQLQDLAADLLAGKTVLLVTHDPLEALRLGHRIHVMTGRPARIGDALVPDGVPPRQADDPAVMQMQARLLSRLSEAARETSS